MCSILCIQCVCVCVRILNLGVGDVGEEDAAVEVDVVAGAGEEALAKTENNVND
jgi:hypothetical protein